MHDDEVYRALGRIEGKLDQALPVLNGHERRIGSLERWRAYLAGAGVVLFALVSWLFGSRG